MAWLSIDSPWLQSLAALCIAYGVLHLVYVPKGWLLAWVSLSRGTN